MGAAYVNGMSIMPQKSIMMSIHTIRVPICWIWSHPKALRRQ